MQCVNKLKAIITISVILLTLPYLLFAQNMSKEICRVEFSQSDLSITGLNGYDVIYMKETSVMSELGKPVLPMKHVAIAIPGRAVSVQVRSLNSIELVGDFYVMPGQPPRPIGQIDPFPSVKPDAKVYDSSTPYPGDLAILDHQGNLAGQQIVWVAIYPLQYVPSERKLILHNQVEVIVCYEQDITSENNFQEHYFKFTKNQHKTYETMIKKMVVNPQDVHLNPLLGSPSPFVRSDQFDHVIITSNALASYFKPLIDWHMKKGMRDTVVTTEWIYANYPGPSDTLKIRQFVVDANANWGTMYFLMGGEDATVPFCRRSYEDPNTPSDQYYSDFDDDWIHEVFVGRASVDNETQINTFINKVLKYEKDPPLTNYLVDALLIGMDLDDLTPTEQLMEEIVNFIPGYINENKVYDSHGGNHRDAVLTFLNDGQNLVAHSDHSNATVMGTGYHHHGWSINNSDVNSLTNNYQTSIITSTGCLPNKMDYSSDCISERFVIFNDNQAGVAFIGNTGHGLYYQGYPLSLSSELVRDWWYGVFPQDQDDLGKALVYAKHDFANSGSANKHCEWNYNLLGEPAMPVWTAEPDSFSVSHPFIVVTAPGQFIVQVNDYNLRTPVENALVCCWIPNQNPDMHVTGYTNASGEVILDISPLNPDDTMYVTVTKHNYLPYEGNALVIAPSGPYVYVGSTILNDSDGDGQVNPGESVDYGIYANNLGTETAQSVNGILSLYEPDPYVSITIDSSWYGNIPISDSSLSDPYYHFDVAADCPDSHMIRFALEFHDINDSIFTYYSNILVHAMLLTYQDVIVVDENGIAEPSETVDLVVILKNESSWSTNNISSSLVTSSPYIIINDNSGDFDTIAPGDTGTNWDDPYNITLLDTTPYGASIDFSLMVKTGSYIDTLDFSLDVGKLVPTDTGYY